MFISMRRYIVVLVQTSHIQSVEVEEEVHGIDLVVVMSVRHVVLHICVHGQHDAAQTHAEKVLAINFM